MRYFWKHRSTEPYLYGVDKDTIHIRLTTVHNDFSSVNVLSGDPYDWKDGVWQTQSKEMTRVGSDDRYDYWQTAVQPKDHRLRYGFVCENQQETVYITENGQLDAPSGDTSDYFCMPYLHEADLFKAPDWTASAVWYQIFPDRFANGDPSNDPEGTLPWDSEKATPVNLFGGDLQGVIDHLDHLEELGINAIYFTPIFEALSNHKYDTINYGKIDPQFGDEETFRKLVDAAHDRGIKVMLDAVFNHSGFYFPPFQDVLKKGEASVYKDWFHIKEFPVTVDPPNYETFAYTKDMPKLNTANQEVKEYLLDTAAYWIESFDIDGWRLDVANEVDHPFWRAFRERVKQIKPELYILGEVWHDALPWLRGDQFDAVMNYRLTDAALAFFAENKITSEGFANKLTQLTASYQQPVHQAAFNLLGSHDTPRVLTQCGGNSHKVRLLYAFQMTMPGSPCVYYGDEIGMSGGNDPGCRDCMKWNREDWNEDIYSALQALIALRREESILRDEGAVNLLTSGSEDVIAFSRSSEC